MVKSTTKKIEDKHTRMKNIKGNMEKFEEEFEQLNYETEIERFQKLECLNCNDNLELDQVTIASLMKLGTTSRKVECPHCHMINRLTVKYIEDPRLGTAEFVQDQVTFSYMKNNIGTLTEEERFLRLEGEINRIDRNASKRPPEIKLLMLIMYDILKKDKK